MQSRLCRWLAAIVVALAVAPAARATPANKKALIDYLGPLVPARGVDCRTCHVAVTPTDEDHEHNTFGERLVAVRSELRKSKKPADITARLAAIADEDADGDGVSNIVELLTGHGPGDSADKPTAAELAIVAGLHDKHRKYLAAYPWKPFETVRRPAVPASDGGNPIDAFLGAAQREQGIVAKPQAAKTVQLRRVYLDLIGLPPSPAEQEAFETDSSSDAYERVVDRLLASPQYGERWGRHWMDIWRYSDWAGYGAEVRESQPHIWRWRDWIVESLNADAGYERMVREMLAGDELAPTDPATLRATGFLARQWYRYNRNVILDSSVEHTAKAFLGMTLNCARCHDHKYDPLSQRDYYSFKAFFEGVQVRTDRLPGESDTTKVGLARVYDGASKPTYLMTRGDEKMVDKTRECGPSVPSALGGSPLAIAPVPLPTDASHPDRRAFVIAETRTAPRQAMTTADAALSAARTAIARTAVAGFGPAPTGALPLVPFVHSAERGLEFARLEVVAAQAAYASLEATLRAEQAEDAGKLATADGKWLAESAVVAQRQHAVAKARRDLLAAEIAADAAATKGRPAAVTTAITKAKTALATADAAAAAPLTTRFTRRPEANYPEVSTGRRLALANWITDRSNPLAARVAVNHIWARHFGQPLVPTTFDFGRNGQPPLHPALLDWLAAEFMDRGWSMKHLHRLIVTSAAYRRDSHADAETVARDPDNRYLGRMNSRRMEAEVVRDSVLAVAGQLDTTPGGPDIDHEQGLTTFRRSVYYRHANEKEMLFLSLFDAPNVVECYQRSASIVPQQALALANSSLTAAASKRVANRISRDLGPDAEDVEFVAAAFRQVLSRSATADESRECEAFLENAAPATARERLVHVLFNHNDFVTIR
jgi:hypothetical protein